MIDLDDTPDDGVTAAEYVLRLLDAEAVLAFEKRLLDDAELRRLVHAWEAHFVGLSDELPPVPPPAMLKKAILNRVAPQARRRVWNNWFVGFGAAVAMGAVALAVNL